jgi:hypothetical protein
VAEFISVLHEEINLAEPNLEPPQANPGTSVIDSRYRDLSEIPISQRQNETARVSPGRLS